jgi:DNA repair protein RadC
MEEKNVTFSIKNWKEDDRPREKLLTKGKDVLSDAELIAIILGSGSRRESALDLAKRILSSVENNLSTLAKLSIPQLMAFNGIGEAKSVSVVTALEIGRRRRLEEALTQSKISSSKSVFDIMQPILGELQHEEFWIVYLNNSNKILLKFQMSKGGISGTLVDTRLVFKKAVEIGATSIILVHNHPSGTLVPSNADKMLTQKIFKAGQTLDIKVLDHIIVTEKSYFSFADSNAL